MIVAVNYIGCGDHCAIDTDVKHVRYLKLKTVFCQLYLNGKKKNTVVKNRFVTRGIGHTIVGDLINEDKRRANTSSFTGPLKDPMKPWVGIGN